MSERMQDVEEVERNLSMLRSLLTDPRARATIDDGLATIRALRSERDEALRSVQRAREERDFYNRLLDKKEAALSRKDAALGKIARRVGRPKDYADKGHRCTWREQAERAVQIADAALASEPGHEGGDEPARFDGFGDPCWCDSAKGRHSEACKAKRREGTGP